MQTQMTILRPGKAAERSTVELPQEPGYFELQRIVEPHLDGYRLERVAVLFEGEPCDMFVGDESAVIPLDRNEEATAIYRANWLSQHPGCDPETIAAVYGPAVLFHRRVWF